jgi:hypothetical protein
VTTGGPAPTPAVGASLPIAAIDEVLRLLLKALRAVQLYPANNATRVRAIENARGAFVALWAELPELVLEIRETELLCAGESVWRDGERAGDSLPWLLHKDGLRELCFTPGFEGEELGEFLAILQRVRLTASEEDDLITLLWTQEFAHLEYRYVDLGFDGAVPSADDERRSPGGEVEREAAELASAAVATSAHLVNTGDFDSALYFLSERELDYLREEVRREYDGSPRESVLAILLDIFESQPDDAVRDEVLRTLDGLVVHYLAAGEYRAVAYLLRETAIAASRATPLAPSLAERARALPDRLSERGPLSQLLQSLDDGADMPPRSDLDELFSELRPAALGTVLEWAARARTPAVRAMIEGAAARLVTSNTAELVRLIGEGEPAVAQAAARRAGELQVIAAVAPLARMLEDESSTRRLCAAEALAAIGSAGAMQALERGLGDEHRDVRLVVARALGARRHRAAAPRLETAIREHAVRGADLTEKMVLFEAYGALCGDAGVPLLDRLLNGRSLIGRREDPEVRACAALALGRVGTATSAASLERARDERDPVVRNAVGRAMREAAT